MSDLRSRLDALDKAARWDDDISLIPMEEWRPARKARDILKSPLVSVLSRALLEVAEHTGPEAKKSAPAWKLGDIVDQALAELAKALERS